MPNVSNTHNKQKTEDKCEMILNIGSTAFAFLVFFSYKVIIGTHRHIHTRK